MADLSHRVADVELTVVDAAGRAAAGAEVQVEQVWQRFGFGCNAYLIGRCGDERLEEAYRRQFAAVFNFATLPFYWGGYEPEPGQTQRQRVTEMARWCGDNGIRAKGHPLCWHEVVPRWLVNKPVEEIAALQWGRIEREVGDFRELIGMWDVINETCAMPTFQGGAGIASLGGPNPIVELCNHVGRVELIRKVFAVARAANPGAVLVLNDYDTTGRYERVIEECLGAGVAFDAIGIQSHMHVGYRGGEWASEVCRRFARFGKPLHWTEATILSGRLKDKDDRDWHTPRPDWVSTPEGEERQAREVEEFYRVLFADPAVEAITWWDFADLSAWQRAPAGFLRKDLSPKPAYEVLRELVRREWRTGPTKLTADAAGRVRFKGFLGAYRVTSANRTETVSVEAPGSMEVTATLR